MRRAKLVWGAYKELSAAKEALVGVAFVVATVAAYVGVRTTQDAVIAFIFTVTSALCAAAAVLFGFAALVHRTTGTSPIIRYVERASRADIGHRTPGVHDPALYQGSRGMHPWLMDPTAKFRLPIGGATGEVPAGLTRYSGRVTEWLGGAPIAGVMVWAESQLDQAVRTDGEGEWRLDLTSGRRWTIYFEREGYERPTPRQGTPEANRIDVQLKRSSGG